MSRSPQSGASRPFVGALALLLAAACGGPTVKVYEAPDGAIVVESAEVQASVTAINARARTVTLKRRFHSARTFTVGEGALDLDQIQVGDEVHAVVVEELAVSLVPGGVPPMVGEMEGVALAPEGGTPGLVMADSVLVTARIIAIDRHAHQLTLEFQDGSGKTVKVGKHIDLDAFSLGDSVAILITEAIALQVTKPH